MRQLSWEGIREEITLRARLPIMRDYLSMKGLLGHEITSSGASSALFTTAEKLEVAIREAYPSLSIEGIQSSTEPNPFDHSLRYWGDICSNVTSGNFVNLSFRGYEPIVYPAPIERAVTIFGILPLGAYEPQTREALRKIWPHIRGLDVVLPGSSPVIPKNKQGNFSLLSIRGGKPQASGEFALANVGVNLPHKKVVAVPDGILI